MSVLKGKKIALVVTGGIAAYKAAELCRALLREGAEVRAAMTAAATRFITPLTLQTLTGHPVASDLWSEDRPREIAHIALADWAEVVVAAPATANLIGKMAGGLADDFVTTFLLATKAPILICPAMNVNMYDHPAVQGNLEKLRNMGSMILEPDSGELACGWQGRGRLPDAPVIIEALKKRLGRGDMTGLTVMVTAGPTREAWDDIRYISNRSSGRMGYALARTALRRGAKVILVSGPVNLEPPPGVELINVESTRDMKEAVLAELHRADILVKAAAPGDFRPENRVAGKIKKTGPPDPIALTPNPDILLAVSPIKGETVVVGFAAEAENMIENARKKLKAKNMDLIAANRIGSPDEAFGAATNRITIIDRNDRVEESPLLDKEDAADLIWDRALAQVSEKKSPGQG